MKPERFEIDDTVRPVDYPEKEKGTIIAYAPSTGWYWVRKESAVFTAEGDWYSPYELEKLND